MSKHWRICCRTSSTWQDLETLYWKTISILCVPLKTTTFGVSFPEVIMNANVFTMSILCALSTHNLLGVISGSDNDCQCFYLTTTSNLHKTDKSVALTPKMKNDVTRQAKFVGDSYRRERTSPAIYELRMIENHDKTWFSKWCSRLAIHISLGHRNNSFLFDEIHKTSDFL